MTKELTGGRCVGTVLGVSVLDSDAVACDVLNVVVGSLNGEVSTVGDGSVNKTGPSVEVVVIREEVEVERLLKGDTAAADLRGTLVHRKP